ncbi:MAG: cardiolipin synthase [Bacteroidota bacterium]
MSFIILEIAYVILLILVCFKIIYDTTDPFKTTAYLLLAIFIPVVGMVVYFVFGTNYRKRLIYTKKLVGDEQETHNLNEKIVSFSADNLQRSKLQIREAAPLVNLLMNDSLSPLTHGNDVKLLLNGEEKFPEVFDVLHSAKHHIHLEYYMFEDDEVGNHIKDILIQKAQEGVEVRVIYDDLGSRSVRKTIIPVLKKAGVEAFPFNGVTFSLLANRINYRNHRKIIIVDGSIGFVGGINICDKYINKKVVAREYWRDTHVRIDGSCVLFLQHIFLCDWNFCAQQKIGVSGEYFPEFSDLHGNYAMQIAASGPDSPTATIMLTFLKAIQLAKKEIIITTPYFIPPASIIDALKVAALGGVSITILVPGISDSRFVNAAAWTNYGPLLRCGVEIYLYEKGFIHAKTMVVDKHISIVGTANMDIRSFDLNFEVNAVVYSHDFASQLGASFVEDLHHARKLEYKVWLQRPVYIKMFNKLAGLLSPLF